MPRGPRRKETQSEEDISADKARSFDEWMKERRMTSGDVVLHMVWERREQSAKWYYA